MNAANPYLNEYKKNQVETATPEQILILLYDGAIGYLNKAKIGIEQSNDDQIQSNLLRCEKILIEFMNTLDMENGGEFATTLYELYRYYYKTLVTVGITRSIDKLDEVLRHLSSLREAWLKAIEISNNDRKTALIEENDGIPTGIDYYDVKKDNEDDEDVYEDNDDEEDDDESEVE